MTWGATSADWTPERRKKMSKDIHKWRPWDRSTGPRTDLGKSRSAYRALKSGTNSAEVIEARGSAMALRRVEKEILALTED